MSIKTKNYSAAKITSIIRSQQLYCQLTKECNDKGLISLTDKQAGQLNTLSKYNFIKLPSKGCSYTVLTDKARRTVKASIITPSIPHSPLRMSNQASTKALETMNVVKLMKGIQKMRDGSTSLYTDFVTLTFQNVSRGQLHKAMLDLKSGYRQLKDYMRKTLPFAKDNLLGGLPSFEVTLNKTSLEKCSSANLYHPHIHLVLFFSKSTIGKEKEVADLIYAKWSSICEKLGHKTVDRAYFYEHSFVKDSNGNKIQRSNGDEAISEAVKYSIKPQDINRLSTCKNKEFKLQVFAELYKNYVRKDKNNRQVKFRIDSFGIVKEARQYLNAFKKTGLAGLFAMQLSDNDLVKVPSIFTRVSRLVVDKIVKSSNEKGCYKFYSHYSATERLNNAELLYYNSALVSNVIFKNYDLNLIKKMVLNRLQVKRIEELNSKQQTMFWLLENWISVPVSFNDIDNVFADWLKTCKQANESYASSKYSDVKMLRDAFNWAFHDTSSYKKTIVRNFAEESKAELVRKISEKHDLNSKDIDDLTGGFVARDNSKLWNFLSDYTKAVNGKRISEDGSGINGMDFWTNNDVVSPAIYFSKIVAAIDDYAEGFDLMSHALGSDYLEFGGYLELGSENRHVSFECNNVNYRFAKCISSLKATRQEKRQAELKLIAA